VLKRIYNGGRTLPRNGTFFLAFGKVIPFFRVFFAFLRHFLGFSAFFSYFCTLINEKTTLNIIHNLRSSSNLRKEEGEETSGDDSKAGTASE
jgi:hypothetical protein